MRDDPFGLVRDDPRLARVLRRAFEGMAEAGPPELRELAAEVLAGRTTLRQAMLSGAYREQVATAGARFAAWYQALDPAEREACRAAGRATLEAAGSSA
jgi:hypothetical protein